MRIRKGIIALALVMAGCTAHVEYLPNAKGSVPTFPLLSDQDNVLVGVALSGGGSRAAVFAAGGLEALAKRQIKGERRSLVEKISHISSVSGGSLAASYYAMQKPSHVVPVLTPGGAFTNEYREFFDQFKDAMSENFQGPMEWRQFKTLRWGNPALRAKSLAEVLDDSYLGKQTLQDLYKRETERDTPRLLINSTLYNNGRRLVITTLPQEAFEYDFVTKVRAEMEALFENRSGYTPFPPGIGRAKKQFIPLTLSAKEINADGRTVALSQAVSASASFPPIVGPITMQVKGAQDFLHLGDGGLFDNQGVESIIQVMLKKLEEGKAKRALIIAFDSSYPFWAGNSWLNQTDKGFSVYFKDPARIVGIMEQRAIMYQTMLFHILQTEKILLPDTRTFKVIVLRHTDAKWKKDLSDLPQACKAEPVKWTSEKIIEYLAEIPTLLKIRSQCDKQLLTVAAAKVVTQHQDEIMQFLTSN